MLDLIITNTSHKYTSTGIFCNDVSNNFANVCVRNTNIPKVKHCFITMNIFLKDILKSCKLSCMICMTVILAELLWFRMLNWHGNIFNKYVPIKKFRISGRDNPWFSDSLSELISLRNKSWAQARFSNSSAAGLHLEP